MQTKRQTDALRRRNRGRRLRGKDVIPLTGKEGVRSMLVKAVMEHRVRNQPNHRIATSKLSAVEPNARLAGRVLKRLGQFFIA